MDEDVYQPGPSKMRKLEEPSVEIEIPKFLTSPDIDNDALQSLMSTFVDKSAEQL